MIRITAALAEISQSEHALVLLHFRMLNTSTFSRFFTVKFYNKRFRYSHSAYEATYIVSL